MWKLLIVVILVIFITSNNIISANGITTISVNCPSTVNVGDVYNVDIIVNSASNIAGIQFNIDFDNANVNSINCNIPNTFFNYSFGSNKVSNVVVVMLGSGAFITSNVKVVTIKVNSEKSGICNFNLSNIVIGDINGNSLDYGVINSSTNIINNNDIKVIIPFSMTVN